MRILVIEDEYSLADLIADRLKKESYKVDFAMMEKKAYMRH